MHFRPSVREVLSALKALKDIPRPCGDNDGDPINGDTVFPYLTPEEQEKVRNAEDIAYSYVRTVDGLIDRRAMNTLIRNGVTASLGVAQYREDWDPDDRLVGNIICGEWPLDISDPNNAPKNDD